MATRRGNEKAPRNVPRRTAAGRSEAGEGGGGLGGRLGYHPGEEGKE